MSQRLFWRDGNYGADTDDWAIVGGNYVFVCRLNHNSLWIPGKLAWTACWSVSFLICDNLR
jgi:hypothetical protein